MPAAGEAPLPVFFATELLAAAFSGEYPANQQKVHLIAPDILSSFFSQPGSAREGTTMNAGNMPQPEPQSQPPTGAVMVIGGGISGMQSALDLANAGFKVYLVESSPAIGGKMAQLDKTFPTNDCSMCIVSPKLVEVGRHKNIELMT